MAAYKTFRNDQYFEVSKEGRSKKESYTGGSMRTQTQGKDVWQGESEMIERSMGNMKGGSGSSSVPAPSASGGSSTTRRMWVRISSFHVDMSMFADDCIGQAK